MPYAISECSNSTQGIRGGMHNACISPAVKTRITYMSFVYNMQLFQIGPKILPSSYFRYWLPPWLNLSHLSLDMVVSIYMEWSGNGISTRLIIHLLLQMKLVYPNNPQLQNYLFRDSNVLLCRIGKAIHLRVERQNLNISTMYKFIHIFHKIMINNVSFRNG